MRSRMSKHELSLVALGVATVVGIMGTVTSAQAATRPPEPATTAIQQAAVKTVARTKSKVKGKVKVKVKVGSGVGHGAVKATLRTRVMDGREVVGVVHLVATAYGPSAQDNYPYGATNYFGAPLTPGTVAVDPAQIPLGTRLVVKGYHTTSLLPPGGFVGHALDTGDAIGEGRIDVYLNAPNAVVQAFGVQHVTAYILGRPAKA